MEMKASRFKIDVPDFPERGKHLGVQPEEAEAGSMKLSRLRGTVAARILVSLVGVSSIGIILAVTSVSLQSARVLRATIADRNLEIARQSAREISRYITESIDELSALNALVAAFPRNTFVQRTVLSDMTLEFPQVSTARRCRTGRLHPRR